MEWNTGKNLILLEKQLHKFEFLTSYRMYWTAQTFFCGIFNSIFWSGSENISKMTILVIWKFIFFENQKPKIFVADRENGPFLTPRPVTRDTISDTQIRRHIQKIWSKLHLQNSGYSIWKSILTCGDRMIYSLWCYFKE